MLIDTLELDLKKEKMRQIKNLESLVENACQTEKVVEDDKELEAAEEEACKILDSIIVEAAEQVNGDGNGNRMTASTSDLENNNLVVDLERDQDEESEQLLNNHITERGQDLEDLELDEDDDNLLNHPKVLYEDELILFKEKCCQLTNDNVDLTRQLQELTTNIDKMKQQSLNHFLVTYFVPICIFFVAFLYYLLRK